MKALPLFFVAAFALAGCASGPLPPATLNENTEQRLTAADAVPVWISDADKVRADDEIDIFNLKARQSVATGPVWARAFVGNANGDPVFRITSAVIDDSSVALGHAIRFTYKITGELEFQGRVYPIVARGSRAAGLFVQSARQQAVELGVRDAAQQVRAVIFRKE